MNCYSCEFPPRATVIFLTHCASWYDSIEVKLKLGMVRSVSCVVCGSMAADNQRKSDCQNTNAMKLPSAVAQSPILGNLVCGRQN